MYNEENHAAEAQARTQQGHDRPSQGSGFNQVRLSSAVAFGLLQNSLVCPLPFTAGIEDKTAQHKHHYRPNLFGH